MFYTPILFFILVFYSSLTAVENLVIIGKGPAGCSAAIFAGQAQLTPLVVEGQECDGQVMHINNIENYPGFPEGITGEELIERMRLQAEKCGAHFKDNYVVKANFKSLPYELTLNNGEIIYSKAIIIATGSAPRMLGLNEETLQGVSTSATCDAKSYVDKSVVVAGGGDAALEQALYLTEYAKQVTIIHRGKELNASHYLVERINTHPKINIRLNAHIQNVIGNEDGWIKSVVLKTEESLLCEGLFIAIGRQPSTGLFRNQLEMDSSGYLITNQGTSMTSLPGIFAAGDIVPHAHRKVITAAASGYVSASEAILFLKN